LLGKIGGVYLSALEFEALCRSCIPLVRKPTQRIGLDVSPNLARFRTPELKD